MFPSDTIEDYVRRASDPPIASVTAQRNWSSKREGCKHCGRIKNLPGDPLGDIGVDCRVIAANMIEILLGA